MVDFQQSKTKENLARSFAAECQEGARYQFMSQTAMQDGYTYMSALIRTLAHNEMAHAKQFFQMITKYGGDNVQNIDICAGYPFRSGELVDLLKLESENEHSSGENIYPEFAKIAQEEGYKDVAKLFTMVADVEKGHERILTQLHEELKGKTLYKCCEGEGCFKCDECGTVQTGKCAPVECPLCHQPQGYYRINITMNRTK